MDKKEPKYNIEICHRSYMQSSWGTFDAVSGEKISEKWLDPQKKDAEEWDKKHAGHSHIEPKKDKYMEKYIVRGDRSGVFFGEIQKREGREVTMKNVRRLWYWDGAASISQLAQRGTVCPENCKFTVTVDEVLVLDAIEIDKCTAEAIKSIEGVPEWVR